MDVDQLSEADRVKYMKEGRCFICAKTGHRSSDTSFHPKKKNVRRQDIEDEEEEEEEQIGLICKVGDRKEMRIPISLISSHRPKTIETTAVVDSGASRTFISEDFVRDHGIKNHRLKKTFRVRNADGTNSGKGKITHY
ncbi:hypothetical protein CY34DRAFT_68060, partial [Suillus luteus UH-Slu-Lm8-n1]